jgi:hypothetical protein
MIFSGTVVGTHSCLHNCFPMGMKPDLLVSLCEIRSKVSQRIREQGPAIQLATDFTEQRPSWEADSSSRSQESPRSTRSAVSLPCSQMPVSSSRPGPEGSSPRHSIFFFISILILYNLCLCLPSGLFTSGLYTKTIYKFILSLVVPHAWPISSSSICSA